MHLSTACSSKWSDIHSGRIRCYKALLGDFRCRLCHLLYRLYIQTHNCNWFAYWEVLLAACWRTRNSHSGKRGINGTNNVNTGIQMEHSRNQLCWQWYRRNSINLREVDLKHVYCCSSSVVAFLLHIILHKLVWRLKNLRRDHYRWRGLRNNFNYYYWFALHRGTTRSFKESRYYRNRWWKPEY